MNTHLNNGQLRAALDGELNPNELAQFAKHAKRKSRRNLFLLLTN